MGLSIFQQVDEPINADSNLHLITGIPAQQQPDSSLLRDARFGVLSRGSHGAGESGAEDASKDVQALFALFHSGIDKGAILQAMVVVLNKYFMKILGLAEAIEPAKQLAVYAWIH